MKTTRSDETVRSIVAEVGARVRKLGASRKKRRRKALRDSHLYQKRLITAQEIERQDDTLCVIIKLTFGILVLRQNANPQHRKIRKLLDRIGIVGIGTDGALDILHDLLEMRIEQFLRPGYTRGDVWGSELGKFASRVLGEFFFRHSDDDDEMSIFPLYAFLFEVGHPVYGNFVELLSFDGKTESQLPQAIVFSSKTTLADNALMERVGETLKRSFDSLTELKVDAREMAIYSIVGNVVKTIRASREAPFFECVYLDGIAAAQGDFKRVWNNIDVEAAISAMAAASHQSPPATGADKPPAS